MLILLVGAAAAIYYAVKHKSIFVFLFMFGFAILVETLVIMFGMMLVPKDIVEQKSTIVSGPTLTTVADSRLFGSYTEEIYVYSTLESGYPQTKEVDVKDSVTVTGCQTPTVTEYRLVPKSNFVSKWLLFGVVDQRHAPDTVFCLR